MYDLTLAMRRLTYQTDLAKSAIGVIGYMVMIYFLVKFLIIYIKRLFVTSILIILGPLMRNKICKRKSTNRKIRKFIKMGKRIHIQCRNTKYTRTGIYHISWNNI